jgi:hypothetical protein
MEYYSAIKGGNLVICKNMDGAGDCHINWNNPGSEGQALGDLTHLWNIKKLILTGIMAYTCNPSYSGGRDRRIPVQGWSWDKSGRTYLKNKLKQKGLGAWLKLRSDCLASARPWFQNSVLSKKKKKKKSWSQNESRIVVTKGCRGQWGERGGEMGTE